MTAKRSIYFRLVLFHARRVGMVVAFCFSCNVMCSRNHNLHGCWRQSSQVGSLTVVCRTAAVVSYMYDRRQTKKRSMIGAFD